MSTSRGSVTVEAVLVAPILVLILGFVSAAGRSGATTSAVRWAADSAARRASMVSRAHMKPVAEQEVWQRLAGRESRCSRVNTEVVFHSGASPKFVEVRVTCRVMPDGVFAFLSRGQTVSRISREVIDVFTYR